MYQSQSKMIAQVSLNRVFARTKTFAGTSVICGTFRFLPEASLCFNKIVPTSCTVFAQHRQTIPLSTIDSGNCFLVDRSIDTRPPSSCHQQFIEKSTS